MNDEERRVLIVDDDPDIRTFLEVTLEMAEYEVTTATNGEEAVSTAITLQPAIILMDVMMPKMDGIEACKHLREDGRTSHIPIIMLTARAQSSDKVQGLTAGADDYVTKPFDPDELIARVQSTLRRAEEMAAVSPLTGLPANARIEKELQRRVDIHRPFALLYVDMNQFKSFNDHYGFLRGDDMIKGLADILTDVAGALDDPTTFIGHIGGDDFIVVIDADALERVADAICTRFDAFAPTLYDPVDRDRGHIEVVDRRGQLQRFPIVSVSIGIATNRQRTFNHHTQVVEIATEMKSFAKRASRGPSNWALDQRTDVPGRT